MDTSSGDEVYEGWIDKWRRWKHVWCESKEPVVNFYVRFLCKDGHYDPEQHACLASQLSVVLGNARIKRDGLMYIATDSIGDDIIIKIIKCNGKDVDKFGVVTFNLSMFIRKDILVLVRTLEYMGHGVIHNGGQIVSSDYEVSFKPSKMPCRDDPVWELV